MTDFMSPKAFKVGQRVRMHPATDWFIRGAVYGDVVRVGRKYVHVKLDKWPRPIRVSPANVQHCEFGPSL
jgi:hypothetical protein